MNSILIVEDDLVLARELQTLLERNNYKAQYLEDFSNPEASMEQSDADLILLDINLPGVDGRSLLRQFRNVSTKPVIMVTSQNTDMDELLCMSFGADDFVTKPYNPSILLLHVEAVLKRCLASHDERLHYQQLELDPSKSEMRIQDVSVSLTKNELGILAYLIRNRGRIVSREELMDYLWDSDEFVDDNTLTVNINRVRKKLENYGMTDCIQTKRGQGYILQ